MHDTHVIYSVTLNHKRLHFELISKPFISKYVANKTSDHKQADENPDVRSVESFMLICSVLFTQTFD